MKKPRVLVIIPARRGSKRIPNKNIRLFAGKPLIAHTIKQALSLPFVGRVVVDTDSAAIAKIARAHGADVPFLRPAHLAKDTSLVIDSIQHLLGKLAHSGYKPDYLVLLQTTSPLREIVDINACWNLMQKGGATTVLTVAPTHPRLYHLDKEHFIKLVNGSERQSTNMQAWREAYLLNGCFVYIINVRALQKENRIITKKTKAIISPKWRSIDLDTPEEWVLAELVFKNKAAIAKRLKTFV